MLMLPELSLHGIATWVLAKQLNMSKLVTMLQIAIIISHAMAIIVQKAGLDPLAALKSWFATHYSSSPAKWHAVVRSDGTRLRCFQPPPPPVSPPSKAAAQKQGGKGGKKGGGKAASTAAAEPAADPVSVNAAAEDAAAVASAALDALEVAVRSAFSELDNRDKRARKKAAVSAAAAARTAKGRSAPGSSSTGKSKGKVAASSSNSAGATPASPSSSSSASETLSGFSSSADDSSSPLPAGYVTTRQVMEALLTSELQKQPRLSGGGASETSSSSLTGKGSNGKGRSAKRSAGSAPVPHPTLSAVAANNDNGTAACAAAAVWPSPLLSSLEVAPPPGTIAITPLLPGQAYRSPYSAYTGSSTCSSGPSSADGDSAGAGAGVIPRPYVFFSVPRETRHQVVLTWALPPLLGWYWHAPERVLGELLGHEVRLEGAMYCKDAIFPCTLHGPHTL